MTIAIAPSGTIIADNVSYDDFLRDRHYDGRHVEWVAGKVIEMSPVTEKHNDLSVFLMLLFKAYGWRSGEALQVYHDPMLMRPAPDLPARAPDVQVIKAENRAIVQPQQIAGPADLVVEIVSAGSHRRDRVEKFSEYERGGVPEYWIIDPQASEALFYQRGADGLYGPILPDDEGVYRSRVLPRLRLNVALFWEPTLPDMGEILALVEAMLHET